MLVRPWRCLINQSPGASPILPPELHQSLLTDGHAVFLAHDPKPAVSHVIDARDLKNGLGLKLPQTEAQRSSYTYLSDAALIVGARRSSCRHIP